MILYHGSDSIVEYPDTKHSQKHLDFGVAFYVTTVKKQAERWARRKAMLRGSHKGYISVYELLDSKDLRIFDFKDDLEAWIDFVCQCRDGSDIFKDYDVIMGKVADDKVFRVVDMYKRGIWDKKRTLKEIRVYENYDQIAFVSQRAIDTMLKFKESYEVLL